MASSPAAIKGGRPAGRRRRPPVAAIADSSMRLLRQASGRWPNHANPRSLRAGGFVLLLPCPQAAGRGERAALGHL